MSNRGDKSIQMLSMPALGRHFDLGTVYDAVRDAIIPGYTFWNGSDLKNVQSTVINHTDFSIIASDKFADKFQELKFNGSLQVSILCGQIELGGSANYLSQKKSTSRESSVHLTLKRRTAVKKLVGLENNMAYRDIQTTGKIGSATHIVTQIEYGAEATFTFTKKLSETENQQEVNGQLKLGAEKIQKCLAGNANVGGSWANTNQENEDNIECHFQGNFELPNEVESPTTFKEAIEFAKKFLQFSSDRVAKDDADGNKSLGVPVIVWLYPLKDAQAAPALRYEIPHWMASQCFLIMENYSEVEDKLFLILEDPLLENLSPLQNKLQHFQRYLTSVIAELKNKLWEMVVGFRGGKIQEEDFKMEMDRISNEKFTFNSNRLKQWLAQKNKELCLIKRFQDEAKSKIKNQSKVHFFPCAKTLQEKMTKFPVDCGLEFSFSYLSHPEPFMELLKQRLGTIFFNEIPLPTSNDFNLDCCYGNDSVVERTAKEIVIFAELVNAKSKDEKFAFVMTALDEYNETCANEFSIIVHNKQKKFSGWDAVSKVICHHYPKEKMIDIIRLLVEEKIPEEWNSIPLLALCTFYKKDNLIEIVKLLIDKKIDVNCKTSDGSNALLILCRYYKQKNLIDIVQLLIKNNIDVNCKNDNKLNALLFLCKYYDKDNLIEIVQLLIGKKIDVKCETNQGYNALHFVCRYAPKTNLVDLVSILVRHKIDKKVKTADGSIGTAHSLLLERFKEEEIADVLQLLDS